MAFEDAEAAIRDGGDHDKTYWETKKLQAEIASLRRPSFVSTQTLVALITAGVAVVGAGFQFQFNQVRAEEAALALQKAQDEAQKVQDNVNRLNATATELQSSITALEQESERAGKQLADSRAQLATIQNQIQQAATTSTSPQTQQALADAQRNVAVLAAATEQAQQAQVARADRLKVLKRGLPARALAETGR